MIDAALGLLTDCRMRDFTPVYPKNLTEGAFSFLGFRSAFFV